MKKSVGAEFKKLDAQEDRLIVLAGDGGMAIDRLRERLEQASLKKGVIEEKPAQTQEQLNYGNSLVPASVDILANPCSVTSGCGMTSIGI